MKLRFLIALMLVNGCITGKQNPASTQPSTNIDVATTQPSYWLAQPPTAVVNSSDFDRLVSACEDTARDYLFKLDRIDYRAGLITTQPLVSAQVFEPWRQDNRTLYDVEESSIATIRRTIRFEFTRLPDDTWEVAPKVLVERQTIAERRITSVVLYRNVFDTIRTQHLRPTGTPESDQNIIISPRYWYLLRRDPEFEMLLAHTVENHLHRAPG
jgi:hypothetical protein